MGKKELNKKKQSQFDKITIKDIAKIANVSATTVSLSFRSDSRISKKTREKVIKIAKDLNYYPNLAARDLKAGRTKTIGFLINDITNPFYGWMIRTAQEIALEKGFEMIFAESKWSPKHEVNIVNKMLQSRIEGIILCFSEKTDEAYKIIINSGLPHIVVDTRPSYYRGPYVINDAWYAGYLSAKHLAEIGCSKMAVINAKKTLGNFSSILAMEDGFRSYLNEINIKYDLFDIYNSGLSVSAGLQAFEDIKNTKKNYDGFFCMNDLCAIGFMDTAIKNKIIPGKDFAIIGVDNDEFSNLNMISLSSINIPYNLIAKVATEYLIEIIEKNTSKVIKKTIKPELVIRRSSNLISS